MENSWNTTNQLIKLILTQPTACIISPATGAIKFTIIDIKLYVPVVTLLAQDNVKLLQQLKSGFKRRINYIYQKNINQK